jgi:parvulin-like peptidyl-prolyl isomerase
LGWLIGQPLAAGYNRPALCDVSGLISGFLLTFTSLNAAGLELFMRRTLFVLLFLPLLLLACGEDEPLPTVAPEISQGDDSLASPVVSDEPIVLPTETAVPLTPTPDAPLAATVNNEPLPLAAFEAELARYQQAQAELGNPTGEDNYDRVVLDALIEQLLIRQAAAAQGVIVTDEMIDQELANLQSVAGSADNFTAWLETNRYSEAEFRMAVADGMIQEQMVTAVTADVPFAVEQVHARYIQVDDINLANTLLAQIQNGDDFATLAQLHSLDRITGENGGDLDFFAAGTLLVPEVDAAAFALTQPGSVSQVITAVNRSGTPVYYLVQLIERDPERPLDAGVRSILLQQAFETWLDELWQAADIVRLVDVESGS